MRSPRSEREYTAMKTMTQMTTEMGITFSAIQRTASIPIPRRPSAVMRKKTTKEDGMK